MHGGAAKGGFNESVLVLASPASAGRDFLLVHRVLERGSRYC